MLPCPRVRSSVIGVVREAQQQLQLVVVVAGCGRTVLQGASGTFLLLAAVAAAVQERANSWSLQIDPAPVRIGNCRVVGVFVRTLERWPQRAAKHPFYMALCDLGPQPLSWLCL
jgi:hypothetical protein